MKIYVKITMNIFYIHLMTIFDKEVNNYKCKYIILLHLSLYRLNTQMTIQIIVMYLFIIYQFIYTDIVIFIITITITINI